MTNIKLITKLKSIYLPTNIMIKIDPLPPIIRDYATVNNATIKTVKSNRTLILHFPNTFI